MKIHRITITDQLLNVMEEYRRAHGREPVSALEATRWGMDNGLIDEPEIDPVRFMARKMSRAMSRKHIIDEQGRSVRKYHCVREVGVDGTQLAIWNTRDDASPKFMRLSCTQRRDDILHDCLQLKADADSYADLKGVQMELNFDFREDIEEVGLPTEYPDAPPEDDEEDEIV